MDPLHARYPFLSSAREAVQEAGVDLASVVEGGGPEVERALDRVVRALEDGTVGDPHREARVELVSYPVARVLVSLVDEHVLTRRYAHAEAATAHERFTAEFSAGDADLRSVETRRLTLSALLAEFDLDGDVRPRGGPTAEASAFDVAVPVYLRLAADVRGDRWRLVNRPLADGWVTVPREDLSRLLEQAVHERVAAGLPLDVPDAVAAALAGPVDRVREAVADQDLAREIDAVVPELFPPCMQHLLQRVRDGDHLEHHSRFAITSFLTTIGLSTDEIIDIYRVNPGFGEEMTRYQTDHIRGDTSPTEYTPPSCATMQSYGDCVNKDDLCDHIAHPLAYYEAKLDDADEDALDDWRDRDEDD
ncbi:MAG: DNA primase regulatory subunit PriL [Halobacteriaceae archaeon]